MKKKNWRQRIIRIFIVVIFCTIPFFLGNFYHAHQYRAEIEAGQNWETTHSDITNRVKINCYIGNKQIFSAEDTNLEFTQKDFDTNGEFIGHDKNSLIQKVCGISSCEMDEIIARIRQGEDAPLLFSVTLTN